MIAHPGSLPASLCTALAGDVRRVGVITGAGISSESGIQTYRGQGGLYDDPEAGARTIEALSGPTLRQDPDRTWRAVAAIARQGLAARPNPGHDALVTIERRVASFCLLTQNVDGLHARAGSRNVIEIHGNVDHAVCLACGARLPFSIDRYRDLQVAPQCADCGGTLRPDVVLFDEMLPLEPLARLHAEFLADLPELLIVVGTSALFPYIIEPVLHARRAHRLTVEINPEPTLISPLVEHALRGPAGVLLPMIAQAMGAGDDLQDRGVGG